MKEYHKIKTVFKRDPSTNYKTLTNEFACPEFEYLQDCNWIWTEKVDGTNIRVMWDGSKVTYSGETDNSQIPSKLISVLLDEMPASRFINAFGEGETEVCLYGEGCGPGIQKGGENYSPILRFTLFDVKVGEWWLNRENVEEIADLMYQRVVHVVGQGPLTSMCRYAELGFKSEWGDFMAEGLVGRPETELFARDGSRIITKIKHKDFNER